MTLSSEIYLQLIYALSTPPLDIEPALLKDVKHGSILHEYFGGEAKETLLFR